MQRVDLDKTVVSDVMQRNVVTISFGATMAEAAATLARNSLSAAPVVDEFGRLVGLISARHFIARHQFADDVAAMLSDSARLLIDDSGRGMFVEVDAQERIERYMSQGVQTIDEKANLRDAARMMCSGRLHHLVVIDASQRPAGMLSSLDLVAAVWGLEMPHPSSPEKE